MVGFNRQTTAPRPVHRSQRNSPVNHLSSLKPGVVHPVAFIPMLREDKARGRIHFNVEMMETKELLANGVQARFSSWLVPWLSFPRFQGSLDQFNRSWMGKPKTDDPGETVTPFFTRQVYGPIASMPIFKAAGKHYGPTDQVNTMYVEAYNLIQNWRARNASKKLAPRLMSDTSLAPAFWTRHGFEHIVPDFDQAVLHGEVALEVVESKLAVKGIGVVHPPTKGVNTVAIRQGDGTVRAAGPGYTGTTVDQIAIAMDGGPGGTGFPNVYAQMGANSIVVSLANIKKAQALQSWAEVRKRFEGHDDDGIIDMLMAGLTIGDQWLKDPIPLDEDIVTFRQGKRYSSTAGQLDDSAVSGVATGSLYLSVPQIAVGGVIVVLCEILPNQLFERRADPFMFVDSVDELPDAQMDSLDTEKVDVVTNRMVDVGHSAPNDTFGYEPMNARWNTAGPTIGGDFVRPAASTGNTEARQRIWAVEAVDPVLTDDFYIAKDGIHTKPFLNELLDPFQIQAVGNVVCDGLTQFGGVLVEATGNYDKLVDKTKDDKIVKE